MNAIPWYQSKTIWSGLVAAISGIAALTGHTVNSGEQADLTNALSAVANGIAVIASFASVYFRTQASSTIKGSSQEFSPTRKEPVKTGSVNG